MTYNRWIPVEERLPEKEFITYLVWVKEKEPLSEEEIKMGTPEGWASEAEFHIFEWKGERVPIWTYDNQWMDWGKITHWMPLPEGPE